jgi:hypothetical protein
MWLSSGEIRFRIECNPFLYYLLDDKEGIT